MDRLNDNKIEQFINEGYLKIDNAFPEEVANECRKILWDATKCDPRNPATWTQPVIWIAELPHAPFKNAANTILLHNAFDQLTGKGNWIPRTTMGSFPIRFPGNQEASDTGWHVDASFPGDESSDYLQWRINIRSKGRALLMLFLFSDTGPDDAPTRIRAGSHLDVAKILQPAGEKGLTFMELAHELDATKDRKEVIAIGKAGTVFLCHPFIVHAAQSHRGVLPKFMAQPSLLPLTEFNLNRPDGNYCPVEKAILMGLKQEPHKRL